MMCMASSYVFYIRLAHVKMDRVNGKGPRLTNFSGKIAFSYRPGMLVLNRPHHGAALLSGTFGGGNCRRNSLVFGRSRAE